MPFSAAVTSSPLCCMKPESLMQCYKETQKRGEDAGALASLRTPWAPRVSLSLVCVVWTACEVCVSRAFNLEHCPEAVLTRAQALRCWDEGQKTKELFWQETWTGNPEGLGEDLGS